MNFSDNSTDHAPTILSAEDTAALLAKPNKLEKNSSNSYRKYFFYLEHKIENIAVFREKWDALPTVDISTQSLSDILQYLEKGISKVGGDNPLLAKSALEHVIENFGPLEDKIIDRIDSFKSKEISYLLYTAATLGIDVRPEILSPILDGKITIPKFTPQIQWACAVLDSQFPNAKYKAAYDALPTYDALGCNNLINRKQLHDAAFWFNGETRLSNPYRRETIGTSEKSIANIFHDAGLNVSDDSHSLNIFKNAGDIRVDNGMTEAHIEFDGFPHFHYLDNNETLGDLPYKGNDFFRNALLEKANPQARILRLPFYVANNIFNKARGDRSEITSRFHNLFAQAAEAGPGVYRAFYDIERDYEVVAPFAQTASGSMKRDRHVRTGPHFG